nr:hypothetical protein [Actinoplanes durhamensis]
MQDAAVQFGDALLPGSIRQLAQQQCADAAAPVGLVDVDREFGPGPGTAATFVRCGTADAPGLYRDDGHVSIGPRAAQPVDLGGEHDGARLVEESQPQTLRGRRGVHRRQRLLVGRLHRPYKNRGCLCCFHRMPPLSVHPECALKVVEPGRLGGRPRPGRTGLRRSPYAR